MLWFILDTKNVRKASGPKKLIPKVQEWVKCNHRKTDYLLTQALTGHG